MSAPTRSNIGGLNNFHLQLPTLKAEPRSTVLGSWRVGCSRRCQASCPRSSSAIFANRSAPSRRCVASRSAVAAGDAHALVGENGAGKSTLLRFSPASSAPTRAPSLWQDEPLHLDQPARGPRARHRHGLPGDAVVPEPDGDREHLRRARTDARRTPAAKARCDERTRTLLDELHLTISPDAEAESLSAAHRQLLQVARALAFECQILVLDEPTTSLTDAEVDHLFAVLQKLRERGVTLLYVSHRMPEVFRLCERITVLRDGSYVGTYDAAKHGAGRRSCARWSAATCRHARRRRRPSRAARSSSTFDRSPAGPVSRMCRCRCTPARSSASSDSSAPAAPSCSKRSSACTPRNRARSASAIGRCACDRPATPRATASRSCPRSGSAGALLQPHVRHNLLLPREAASGGTLVRTGQRTRGCRASSPQWRIKAAGVDVPPDSLSGGNQQKVVSRQVAGDGATRAAARRAHEGRRRRRQVRDPRDRPPAGRRGHGLPRRLQRPARSCSPSPIASSSCAKDGSRASSRATPRPRKR